MFDNTTQPVVWKMLLFLPSIVAVALHSILFSPSFYEKATLYWMTGNLVCSLVVAMGVARPSNTPATHVLKIVSLGIVFSVLNIFVGFFGGCCAANTFHK